MPNRYRILPYRPGSNSVRSLAEELQALRLRLEGSKYKYKEGDLVINWGNSRHPGYPGMLNPSDKVSKACNKLSFFTTMKEKCPEIIPEFWTDTEEDSIPDEAFPIVCRESLVGHSGVGIHIADNRDELIPAPLYTRYIKKKEEYRVHIGVTKVFVGGDDHGNNTGWSTETKTIAIQRKARSYSAEDVNWQIRNHANGFVFVRNDVNPPACVEEVANEAILATALDFGAVDVIWNEYLQKAFVLEINTAPGLEGQTVKDYAEFFRGF